MIHLVIPGPPRGKQRARTVRNKYTGKSVTFTPEQTESYEDLIRFLWREKRVPAFQGAVGMTVEIYYPIPKSWNKTKTAAAFTNQIRPTCKPDGDNVVKVVMDSLNRGFAYKDDSSVAECIFRKWYSADPRVEVFIWEIV